MRKFVIIVAVLLFGLTVQTQDKLSLTHEEQLMQQVSQLQSQLAQSLRAVARCESGGPQAVTLEEAAKSGMQDLLKALDARGISVNDKGELVPKIKPEPKK